MRADGIIRSLFPSLTRRQVSEAFKHGLVVHADGGRASHPTKKNLVVRSEDLDCTGLRKHIEELQAGYDVHGIRLLAECRLDLSSSASQSNGVDFVVLHKPAGVPSVPIHLKDTLTVTAWMRRHYPVVNRNFELAQPELAVHRLDTDTEGIIVAAVTRAAYDSWREQFAQHLVRKEYIAWVWGDFPDGTSQLKSALTVTPGKTKVGNASKPRSRSAALAPAIAAESEVEVLRRIPERGLTQVRVRTRTGIRHQVRAQLAFEGYPLVGDRIYDDKFRFRTASHPHHMLWASKLDSEFGTWERLPPESWKLS